MKVLIVVEDDPDAQLLIETIFSFDPRFSLAGMAATAELALAMARTKEPGIIVLDHGLSGRLSGAKAASRLKNLAPQTKIILFTAHAELQTQADAEPSIDAFLLKNQSTRLLALAQRLTGLGPQPT